MMYYGLSYKEPRTPKNILSLVPSQSLLSLSLALLLLGYRITLGSNFHPYDCALIGLVLVRSGTILAQITVL